jgi:His/Glu/Gln/Arg/opine family amino acid ABC transporter permease subunit
MTSEWNPVLLAGLIGEWLPQLLHAAGGTLRMTAGAFTFAAAAGLLLALARWSRVAWLDGPAFAYVEVVRGMPALTLLFLIYFGLAPAGIVLPAFTAAVLGLGLNGAAYLAEVYRAGIGAVGAGQIEAGAALGLHRMQVMRLVILPQAVPIVLPPLANYAIALLKDTSVAALIAAPELTLRARDLASEYFLPMQIYLCTGLMYFLMAWPLSRGVRWLEQRIGRKGRTA